MAETNDSNLSDSEVEQMSETDAPDLTDAEVARRLEAEKISMGFRSGANWFYWIAGLSIANSLVILFQGEWGFVVGLGIT
ncbi:MAG: hypothetical protein GY837_07230, partial [Bosea sp.]|uniref:hypothetical protein n=1 Tax=Bosea sp. (in: a-proteobacteria) TaxID=1871050 RepID=UPI0031FE787B|nr:hypothetical protein [Bosea sp. (in: a-proteobacteria)]